MKLILFGYLLPLAALSLLIQACSHNTYRYVRTSEDLKSYITTLPYPAVPTPAGTVPKSPCADFNNYAPDSLHPEYTPVRWIRVNIHVMNSVDSSRNFKEQEAFRFIDAMIARANQKLNENKPMWLPHGNHTTALPPRFQWLLSGMPNTPNNKGIYFHYDDDLFWVNKKGPSSFHSRNVCEKYSIGEDSIINIFMVEHHPDSIKSKTYRTTGDGIGYVNCVKLINAYNNYQEHNAGNINSIFIDIVESFANLFNHELGHSVGLSHTWSVNDGCNDTPLNNNCWNFNEGKNCETEVSNNIMDYNAYRTALTPCQIAKVHYNLSQPKLKQSAFVKPDWCQYDPTATLYIATGDTLVWNCSKDFNGDLVIKSGAQLTLQCSISMPPDSKIVVENGATLILDGCSLAQRCPNKPPWRGIELRFAKMKPKPRLLVRNGASIVNATQ